MKKSRHSQGYILILVGKEHHLADQNGYALEHRYIAEQMLGRRLDKQEIVHHRDHNKKNNHPDNLEVLPNRAHHCRAHAKNDISKRKPIDSDNKRITCACGCGARIMKYDKYGRSRDRKLGHYAKWMNADEVKQLIFDRNSGVVWSELEIKYGRPARSLRRIVSGKRCCADNSARIK